MGFDCVPRSLLNFPTQVTLAALLSWFMLVLSSYDNQQRERLSPISHSSLYIHINIPVCSSCADRVISESYGRMENSNTWRPYMIHQQEEPKNSLSTSCAQYHTIKERIIKSSADHDQLVLFVNYCKAIKGTNLNTNTNAHTQIYSLSWDGAADSPYRTSSFPSVCT